MCTHEGQLGCRQAHHQVLALTRAQGVPKHDGAAARLAAKHAQHAGRRLGGASATCLQQLVQVQLWGWGGRVVCR
jgi:hypothetical protein